MELLGQLPLADVREDGTEMLVLDDGCLGNLPQLVEGGVGQVNTLAKLGIPAATFYRWYDRYSSGGPKALNDRSPRPERVWNAFRLAGVKIIIELALDEPALCRASWPCASLIRKGILSQRLRYTAC